MLEYKECYTCHNNSNIVRRFRQNYGTPYYLCYNCDYRYVRNMYIFKTKQEAWQYIKSFWHSRKKGIKNKYPRETKIPRICYACGVTSYLNCRGEENFTLNKDGNGKVINMLCYACFGHFIYDPPKFQNQEERTAYRKEVRNRIVIPIKDTLIEKKLQDLLRIKKIRFEKHKPILGQPDLFIEPNICIFADGDYWHRISKSLKRDEEVNEYLLSNGYIVARFWEKTIKKDINAIWNILKRLLYLADRPLLIIA